MKLRHNFWVRLLVMAAVVPAVTSSSMLAASVTLKPVADAGLYEDMPSVNQGSGGTMVSGTLRVLSKRRSVLKFDLSGQIPANATVTSATLSLKVVFKLPSGGGVSSTFDLRRITQPWSESGITWNERMPGVGWSSPGAAAPADFSSTVSASKLVSGFGTYVFGPGANLTADVQAWVNNPGSNQGWILITESESIGKTARHFATKEDSANAATLVVEFTAAASTPMAITSTSPLPNGTVGSPYSFTFMVTNGTSPFNWSIISGTLPGGMNMSTAGVLSATPTNAGTFNFTVQVLDNAGATTNQAFTLSINPSPVAIDSVSPLPAGTLGVAYSQTLAASGGQPPYNWSVTTGTLPGGLTLSSAGVLAGTPTNFGTFNFTVQVADNVGASTSKAFALTVNPPALAINTSSPLPAGTVNVPYAQNFDASAGGPPYAWAVVSGSLPGGLSLSSTGALGGTPTNSGEFNFTVEVTDSANVKTSKAFSLTINPPLRIGQASVVGNQISFQFSAQAGQSYAVELNGSLSSTNWQTLTNIAAPASASVITVIDGITQRERYYRVRTP